MAAPSCEQVPGEREPPVRLVRDSGSSLFLDVDGTLLDIAPAPELVIVPAELLATLSRLSALLGGALALVSGRPIVQLDRLFAPLRLPAAGEHGAEIRLAHGPGDYCRAAAAGAGATGRAVDGGDGRPCGRPHRAEARRRRRPLPAGAGAGDAPARSRRRGRGRSCRGRPGHARQDGAGGQGADLQQGPGGDRADAAATLRRPAAALSR